MCSGKVLLTRLQDGATFYLYYLNLARKANAKIISVTSVATVNIQPWEYICYISPSMAVFQICAFHILFLIL